MKTFLALALAFALWANAGPATAEVVLINTFEVPEGEQQAAIAAWKVARDFLAKQPGYISTALHGAVTPNARFALINVAKWKDQETFMAATQAMRDAKIFEPPEGVIANPALYTVVATD
ncbi:MAG: antibiotic biosynthesis monooxygenase family protein [Woeseiaceae bacterium]|nr:antibiotic biosynthesis monooxygenase family protein [Woeseiaceae bacterium]